MLDLDASFFCSCISLLLSSFHENVVSKFMMLETVGNELLVL